MNTEPMKPEEKTSITVRKETRQRLQLLVFALQAERGESLSQDDVLTLLMNEYERTHKKRNGDS
jgi:hypothetical protein